MQINHDMQDLQAEAAYRRDAMQRAVAGSRRRRRPVRRWTRVSDTATSLRTPADG
ncbi:MAG TPA: hypothetical protein VK906_12140 [Egicoccus sp.]|nr:hypothetical protein [Egicoccus sp.]HSK23924.1 hypothetical protein [Egicoccus sp.]